MNKEFLHNLNLRVNNIAFNICFVVWTLVYGVLALPLVLLLPHKLLIEVRKPWISFVLFLLKLFFNISFEVQCSHNIKGLDRFIVASKHHSPLDVLLIANMFTKPAFILKKSLIYIPIFGLYMIATKMITVDFSKKVSGLFRLRKIVKQSKKLAKCGRTIVIYPEGSRVKVGQKVGYQSGVFAVYKELGLPVIPIALNAGSVWPLGYFDDKKPGKVVIKILEPIKAGMDKRTFLAKLEQEIETNSNLILQNQDKFSCGVKGKNVAIE